MTTIVPPYCEPRSAGFLQACVKAEDVEHAPDLQPGFGRDAVTGKIVPKPGWTHCNLFVERVCKRLEKPLPPGMLANEQIDWLRSLAGYAAGWRTCNPVEAMDYASKGQPVICGYRNPKVPPEGHSHIAIVVPGMGVVHIAQAGAQNFSDKAMGFGFGTLPVAFFFNL